VGLTQLTSGSFKLLLQGCPRIDEARSTLSPHSRESTRARQSVVNLGVVFALLRIALAVTVLTSTVSHAHHARSGWRTSCYSVRGDQRGQPYHSDMAKIRDTDLERYLGIFHETYLETAERLLPATLLEQLRRLPLIEAGGIRGYISTNRIGGTAWEYTGNPPPAIHVTHGSSPIEELFFDYPSSLLKSDFCFFRVGSMTLSGGLFKGGRLLKLVHPAFVQLNDLILKHRDWERTVLFAEIATDRSEEFWSDANAITRAKDELVVAAVDQMQLESSRELSLDEYLRRRKDKQVLICGDYKAGQDRLERIKAVVEAAGYEPIRLDEIPDYPHQDLRQKFDAIAPHARFLVIDDSSAAGQMVEVAHAESGRWPTLIVRMRGTNSSYMTRGASATSTVLQEVDYSEDDLEEVLRNGFAWVEKRLAALGEEHRSTFPWRVPPDWNPEPPPQRQP
jgi:hypothetical protein